MELLDIRQASNGKVRSLVALQHGTLLSLEGTPGEMRELCDVLNEVREISRTNTLAFRATPLLSRTVVVGDQELHIQEHVGGDVRLTIA